MDVDWRLLLTLCVQMKRHLFNESAPNSLSLDMNAIVCLPIITTLPVPTRVKALINKWKVPFTGVEEDLANLIQEEGQDEDALQTIFMGHNTNSA